jgi:hypothetical protein
MQRLPVPRSYTRTELGYQLGLPLTVELFHQLAFFISELQAHIVLPLQAYRCLYPLEL